MSKTHNVKVTVLKRLKPQEVLKESPVTVKGEPIGACPVFEDGQEFIIGEYGGGPPEGFCEWAWDDLYKVISILRFGGSFPWWEEKSVFLSCCTDGQRPVIFKLERT